MSSIYSGAMVTISAQSAADVHEGCLQFGQASNAPFTRFEEDMEIEGILRIEGVYSRK